MPREERCTVNIIPVYSCVLKYFCNISVTNCSSQDGGQIHTITNTTSGATYLLVLSNTTIYRIKTCHVFSLKEASPSILYKYQEHYRLYACRMFSVSRSIKSRSRHRASAMVVCAPLLFSQWEGRRLSCSLVRREFLLSPVTHTQIYVIEKFRHRCDYCISIFGLSPLCR